MPAASARREIDGLPPPRASPITTCAQPDGACVVCGTGAPGGIHVRTTPFGPQLGAMLRTLDALDPGFFDTFAAMTVLVYAGRECTDNRNNGYVLFSTSVGGGVTLPPWLSISGRLEIHIWEDLVTGISKAPFKSRGVDGPFSEEPLGVVLHELWHAYLYVQQAFWHAPGPIDNHRACDAVSLLSEPWRARLGYPAMDLSFCDAEVKRALAR